MITEIELITFFWPTHAAHKLENAVAGVQSNSPASYFRKRRTDCFMYGVRIEPSCGHGGGSRHSKAFIRPWTQSARSVISLQQLPEGLLAEATRDACDEHRAPPPRAS
jgi:hypothetical protein